MGAFSTTAWNDTGPEALLLSPLSLLYAGGWISYQSIYALGLKKPAKPHTPIVCIGSLLAGGAGKSPVTLQVARELIAEGRKVVISISGYRSPQAEGATLAPDDEQLDAHTWGDETAMSRWLLPGVPLVVGRDRVRAAEIIHSEFTDSIMLMDDGFQHLRLKTDVSIILDPPELQNRLPLPAGPYREVRSMGRARADLVLPGKFQVVEHPLELDRADGTPLETLPAKAHVLTSIGRPYRVIGALERMGIEAGTGLHLPDHDPLTKGNLLDGLDPALPVIVTAKDWVKLCSRSDLPHDRFLVARHRVTVEPRDLFIKWLLGRLDGIV